MSWTWYWAVMLCVWVVVGLLTWRKVRREEREFKSWKMRFILEHNTIFDYDTTRDAYQHVALEDLERFVKER